MFHISVRFFFEQYCCIISLTAVGEMEEVEVEKMVKLAEQCLERIKSFLGKRNETTVPNSSSTPVQALSLPQISPQTSSKTPGKHYLLRP